MGTGRSFRKLARSNRSLLRASVTVRRLFYSDVVGRVAGSDSELSISYHAATAAAAAATTSIFVGKLQPLR